MASPYDEKAAGWDRPDRIERARFLSDKIREQGDIRPGSRVLDFGAGTRLIGFNFLDTASTLAFIDSSEGMRKVLAEKAKASGRASDILIASSLDDRALGQDAFDAIVTSLALHHVSDVQGTLSGFARLLNKGGKLCIVDLVTDDGGFHGYDPLFDGRHGFDPDALSALCASAGFKESSRSIAFRGEKETSRGQHPYELFLLVMMKRA